MKKLFLITVCAALTACGGNEISMEDGHTYVQPEKGAEFEAPDIKDDFCGVHINYQYCKCGFHGDYCDSVNLDRSGANSYVQGEYNSYVSGLRESFASVCETGNGFMDGDDCYVCPEGTELTGSRCRILEEEGGEVVAAEPEPAADELPSCNELEEDWEKYSDIDWRIPMEERSYEAKQYAKAQNTLVQTVAEKAELQYETELLKQQLADIKDYKAALVDNLRDNLVKATFRLTYVTYSQVNGAKGAGESFSTFLTSAKNIEALGAGMKSIQAVIPGDSQLAINTKTVGGKVESIGWNATLEAIESMGDPSKIAQQVMKDSKGAIVPGADITPEEVEILRQQNLENNLLDNVIAELEAEIADNETWLNVADARIAELEAQVVRWQAEEKKRTLSLLEGECE